jgi:hypothetical protein
MTEKSEEVLNKLYAQLKIDQIPQGLDMFSLNLFKDLRFYLVKAWICYLVDEKRIFEIINEFLKLDIENRYFYVQEKIEKIDTNIKNYLSTINFLETEKSIKIIEEIKSKTDPEIHPLIEYICYSYISNQPIEEEAWADLENYYSLTPEQKQELHELELAKKFSQIKSNRGFKASDLDSNFNKPLDEEMIASILEQNQRPTPTKAIVPQTNLVRNNIPAQTTNQNQTINKNPAPVNLSTRQIQPTVIPQNQTNKPPVANQTIKITQAQTNFPAQAPTRAPQTRPQGQNPQPRPNIPHSFNNGYSNLVSNQRPPQTSTRIFNDQENARKASFLRQNNNTSVPKNTQQSSVVGIRKNKTLADLLDPNIS